MPARKAIVEPVIGQIKQARVRPDRVRPTNIDA
jgi:hypothetical protein